MISILITTSSIPLLNLIRSRHDISTLDFRSLISDQLFFRDQSGAVSGSSWNDGSEVKYGCPKCTGAGNKPWADGGAWNGPKEPKVGKRGKELNFWPDYTVGSSTTTES